MGFRLAFFSIINTYISISTDFLSLFHKQIWKEETNLEFQDILGESLVKTKDCMCTSKVHSSKRQTPRPTLEQGCWLKRSPPS